MSRNQRRPAYRVRVWAADDVRRLREALGSSQQELADELGVRQQTVSDWETGMHTPRGAARRLLTMVAEQRAPYVLGPHPVRETGRDDRVDGP